jgi:hypothetical protein
MERHNVLGMCTKAAPQREWGQLSHYSCLVLGILAALVQLDFILYYLILYFCGTLDIHHCRLLDLSGVSSVILFLVSFIRMNRSRFVDFHAQFVFFNHKQHSSYLFH